MQSTSSSPKLRPPLLSNRLSSSLPQYLVTVAHEPSTGLHYLSAHARGRAANALADVARKLSARDAALSTAVLDARDANAVVQSDLTATAPDAIRRAIAALRDADAALTLTSASQKQSRFTSAITSTITSTPNSSTEEKGTTAAALASVVGARTGVVAGTPVSLTRSDSAIEATAAAAANAAAAAVASAPSTFAAGLASAFASATSAVAAAPAAVAEAASAAVGGARNNGRPTQTKISSTSARKEDDMDGAIEMREIGTEIQPKVRDEDVYVQIASANDP